MGQEKRQNCLSENWPSSRGSGNSFLPDLLLVVGFCSLMLRLDLILCVVVIALDQILQVLPWIELIAILGLDSLFKLLDFLHA